MTIGWCGCCGALRPRYRRLVDNIYPPNPDDGLVKANMDKLVWYAMNSPDKLDRIGEYLNHRLNRDIDRKRHGYACVSMDALDQLLMTCHANSLNLFVEFFLRMVQKLLECTDPALQLRATQSFEKFANIREDTPSYHRRYDFLVSKFASLCYSDHQHQQTKNNLRTAGIKGLQGVVRKTDWDDLGENIWRPGHMEKMVPSLLYNIQDMPALQEDVQDSLPPKSSEDPLDRRDTDSLDTNATAGGDRSDKKSPPELAEACLRELVGRVTYSRIGSVVRPLLVHMDQQKQWGNKLMAVHIFKIIMYSIQAQYNINVVDMLMTHLNDHRTDPSRCGIAFVLGQIIPIAAGECVGPSVIEIINSLLEHVRLSVTENTRNNLLGGNGLGLVTAEEQQQYQDSLIHALAEYTHHLPDFHKIEAMLFILTKVPGSDKEEEAGSVRPSAERRLQHLLLNCLLKIANRYQTSHYYSTFTTAFLARMLRLSVSSDCIVRKLILCTLSALLPRSSIPTYPTLCTDGLSLPARGVPPVRQDTNFWKKCGHEILSSVLDSSQLSNNEPENYAAAYSVLIQLVAEVRAEDVPVDVIRTMMNMQEWCGGNQGLTTTVASVHGLVAAVMVVAAAVVPQLTEHVQAVVASRQEEAVWLLPGGSDALPPSPQKPSSQLLFNRQQIITLLQPTNLNEQRVSGSSSSSVLRRASTTAPPMPPHLSSSMTADAIQEEGESAASSPAIPRREIVSGVEAISFDMIKNAANGNVSGLTGEMMRQQEEQRRLHTYALLHDSYDALLARQEPEPLHEKLTEIFSKLPPYSTHLPTSSTSDGGSSTSVCNAGPGLKPLPFHLPYPDIVIC